MVLDKFFFKKRKVANEYGPKYTIVEAVYKEIYDQFKNYQIPYGLSSRIKYFNTSNEEEKIRHFPSLYLEIEDFLILQKEYASKTKQDYREVILMEHPDIVDFREFYVIFLAYDIQKIALSRLFLKRALHNAKQLLGNFKDSELIKAEEALHHPFAVDKYSTQIEINSIEKKIFDYSQLLQNKLLESLGTNAMLSIYNSAYTEHFNEYYLLQSFTSVINLIPEDLLVLEGANMPSKEQMHRLLKSQISTLEDINVKLSKEILERKEMQRELERNERLYSAVLHNSLNANIIISQQGEIIRWNSKAEELFDRGDNLMTILPKVFDEPLKTRLVSTSLKEIKQLAYDSFPFQYKGNAFMLRISPIFVDNEILFFCVVDTAF